MRCFKVLPWVLTMVGSPEVIKLFYKFGRGAVQTLFISKEKMNKDAHFTYWEFQ